MKFNKEDLKGLIKEVLSEMDPDAVKQVRGVSGQQLAQKMLNAPGAERLIPLVQKAQDLQKVDFLVFMAKNIGITDLRGLAAMIARAEKRMTAEVNEAAEEQLDEITPKTKFNPKGLLGIEKLARENRGLLRSLTDQPQFDDNTPAGRVLVTVEENNQSILNAANLATASSEMATYLYGDPKRAAQITKRMTAKQGE